MFDWFAQCNPCHYHYDAVVRMESFTADSRAVLAAAGLDWVATKHQNNRGSHQTSQVAVKN